MLNVVVLSVGFFIVMLNVIMLSVVMLSVVAPKGQLQYQNFYGIEDSCQEE
jgi:hypothetical protein